MSRRVWLVGLCLLGILSMQGGAQTGQPESPTAALMANYLRYLLLNQVEAQGAGLIDRAPAAMQSGLRTRLDGWMSEFQETIRMDLEGRLGPDARPRFEGFIDDFTKAEQAKDFVRLGSWAAETGWPGPVDSGFEAFRLWGIQQWVSKDMQECIDLLTGMETQVAALANKPAAPAAPKRPANPLRAAESEVPAMDRMEVESGSPLQQFAVLREERRQKALDHAQAGMQQVASEREAWEQEYAGDVAAKAQAEADSMKQQAERLAATDAEALEQRKNSLSAKFVKVLAGVAQSTVGGLTGAIGSRAAGEAVNAIFGSP